MRVDAHMKPLVNTNAVTISVVPEASRVPCLYKNLADWQLSVPPPLPAELRGEMLLTTVLAALLSISFADAAIPNAMLRGRPVIPQISVPEHLLTSPNGTVLPPLTTVYYFDQLIDHNDSSLGTFQQRYWMDWEFYTNGIFFALPLFVQVGCVRL
jgi:hypothetical protein